MKTLPSALHGCWVDQYAKQFPPLYEEVLPPESQLWQLFGREAPNPPKAPPPYQEPDDDMVFEEVVIIHYMALASAPLEEVRVDLLEMLKKYVRIKRGV